MAIRSCSSSCAESRILAREAPSRPGGKPRGWSTQLTANSRSRRCSGARQLRLDPVPPGQPQQQVDLRRSEPSRIADDSSLSASRRALDVSGTGGQRGRGRGLPVADLGELGGQQLGAHDGRIELEPPAATAPSIQRSAGPRAGRSPGSHVRHRWPVLRELRAGAGQPAEQRGRIGRAGLSGRVSAQAVSIASVPPGRAPVAELPRPVRRRRRRCRGRHLRPAGRRRRPPGR